MTGMEPRIQYATTSDGVSIALSTLGEGMPLVIPPPATPWSHIELEWQTPEWRHWYEHLGERCQVIRYDGRGAGLSERDVTDFSLDARVRDLEAVVDRLGLERIALFGCFYAGPIAIAYAARHPERVTHLILWCSFASGRDHAQAASMEDAMRRLLAVDYELYTETLAHTVFGWTEGEAAHALAVYMQNSMTAEGVRQCMGASEDFDVEAELAAVEAPTLVMHRRDFAALDVAVARRLASGIPDARLSLIDGSSLSPYTGNFESSMKIIDEFLEISPDPAKRARPHQHVARRADAPAGGFRTIMFTDMEGSTATTQRLGDAAAQHLVRLHNSIVNEALGGHGGSHVKHTGDGIMASFNTASAALDCAVTIQRAFATHNEDNPGDQIHVRIGINAGEPVIEGDDLFGTAVQLAARVCARAEAGAILTSDVVRQLVAGKDFLFADHGEAEFRGFEDPVRVYEVHWRQDA